MPMNLENAAVATRLENVRFHSNPKERQCQRMYKLLHNCTHLTPVFLPGKSHGRRSLVGCSPWGRKESDMTEWLHFHFHYQKRKDHKMSAGLMARRWCCESAALSMPANLENSAVATGLEKVSFCSNPKERKCQRMLKLLHSWTHLTC